VVLPSLVKPSLFAPLASRRLGITQNVLSANIAEGVQTFLPSGEAESPLRRPAVEAGRLPCLLA